MIGRMSTHIILVPGFWLGAWAWDAVAPALRDGGHPVSALTLPGLEPDHPSRTEVGLDDHVDAIEQAVEAARAGGAGRVVLVAHSGAAMPATMVLDRRPDDIAQAVWVDTAPARDGYGMDAELAGGVLPLEAAWESELEEGSMRDLTDEQLETFRARAVPQPGRTVQGPVRVSDPRRLGVPGTVVCCSYSAADFRSYAEQGAGFLAALLDHTALDYVDLPTGHWPMWSRPDELAEVIVAAAAPHAPDDGGQS